VASKSIGRVSHGAAQPGLACKFWDLAHEVGRVPELGLRCCMRAEIGGRRFYRREVVLCARAAVVHASLDTIDVETGCLKGSQVMSG
jgi:hypothetical protein